jgi:hypothetical protein
LRLFLARNISGFFFIARNRSMFIFQLFYCIFDVEE